MSNELWFVIFIMGITLLGYEHVINTPRFKYAIINELYNAIHFNKTISTYNCHILLRSGSHNRW